LSYQLSKFAATWQNRNLSFRILEEDAMDRLEAMSTFLVVVEAGSLSAAARRLKTPLTTVSRKVSELESHLRTKLFSRSSRQLVLTDAGSSYLAACKRILADVTEAERTASGEYTAPTGELTVTTPIGLGRTILMPMMADFLKAYPDIKARMIPTDRVPNLIQEQIDVGVRIGALPDSSLIAIPVGTTRRVVCASPAYLAARGAPRTPEDLARHDCIHYAAFAAPDVWTFVRDKATIAVPVNPRLVVGSAEAAYAAARAGIGIALAFAYQLQATPEGGALTTVLDDFQPAPRPVNLVYAANRFLPIKVRAFLDFATPRLRRVFAESKPPHR
jgi:DNA-binding transcriptional LysR family regulator